MEDTRITRSLVDAGMVIAIGTTLLYLGDFSFECGRFAYFDLPSDLIDVTVVSILNFTGAIIPLFVLMGPIFYFIYFYINAVSVKDNMSKVRSISYIQVGTLVFSVAVSSLTDLRFPYVLILTLLLSSGLVYYSYRKHLKNAINPPPEETPDHFESKLIFTHNLLYCFLAVLVYIVFCYSTGYLQTKQPNTYLVTGKQNNVIVLARNGDFLVGKHINLKTMQLSDTVEFIKLSEKEPAVLIEKQLKIKSGLKIEKLF